MNTGVSAVCVSPWSSHPSRRTESPLARSFVRLAVSDVRGEELNEPPPRRLARLGEEGRKKIEAELPQLTQRQDGDGAAHGSEGRRVIIRCSGMWPIKDVERNRCAVEGC